MPNLTKILREEIQRLARKEVRRYTSVVKKASAQHRRAIAALKRQLASLQRGMALLDRQIPRGVVAPAASEEASGKRFSAKGLRAQRKRLGLSAGEYGKLVGVTGQAVYNWESGISRPRRQQLPRIVALRSMGKKQVQAQLAKLAPKRRAKKR